LLYTGITRAKKLVVFVGTRKALALRYKNKIPLPGKQALLICSPKWAVPELAVNSRTDEKMTS
jgi:hypothetical protein